MATSRQSGTTSWEDIHFSHISIVLFLAPPDLVALITTCREASSRFDGPDVYRMLTKTCYGSTHRRRRRKKRGEGAKGRLCILWAESVQEQASRIQAAYLVEREMYEGRWVLQKTAEVLRSCVYGRRWQGRQGSTCCHEKLRLWAFAAAITANCSPASERRMHRHPGVKCGRCGGGAIQGPCFRCVGGCKGTGPIKPGLEAETGHALGQLEQEQTYPGASPGACSVAGGTTDRLESASAGVDSVFGGLSTLSCGYNLCESCFERRGEFHPPHPFVCLQAGFAERRLSFPMQYEAICGDCSFGSLVNIRPLRAYEASSGKSRGDLWAVPVLIEAAGPLPLSQVRTRMLALGRHEARGLVFASESWGWRMAPS
ncbi:unnamed protein product [Choristocarpus tenellus]